MTPSSPTDPPWEFREHGEIGSTALVALAEATIERFRARGVPLAEGNRLQRASDVIRASHERRIPVERDDPASAALVAEALRDMWDFYVIARTLPRERDADLEGKLRVMLRGETRAADDDSSTPRDLQFETLVGAVFAMSDIPTRPAPPDLVIIVGDREWGVSVKRVRSEEQLAKRTTKARRQLEEQHLRGIIVVNVDSFLTGVPLTGDPAEIGARFDAGVARLVGLIPELAKQRSLLGIVAMGRVVGWDFEGGRRRLFNPWIFRARAFVEEGEDGALVEGVFQRLQRRPAERISESMRELERRLTGS